MMGFLSIEFGLFTISVIGGHVGRDGPLMGRGESLFALTGTGGDTDIVSGIIVVISNESFR